MGVQHTPDGPKWTAFRLPLPLPLPFPLPFPLPLGGAPIGFGKSTS